MTGRRDFLRGGSVLLASAALPQVMTAFLSGCASTSADRRTPVFLTQPQMTLLEELVDIIIPATDSPAASAASTHWFIDLALPACATAPQQQTFRAGLDEFIASGFGKLKKKRRVEVLQLRAAADMQRDYDQSFFRILKDYTMVGYFQSEIGATQALAYEKVPGGYQGDIPLDPQQKAWAI